MQDFCWSSGWSLTTTKIYADIQFSLWECDAGLFDAILNGNNFDCGLSNYKFKNHLFKLLSSLEGSKGGEIYPETCWAAPEIPEEVPVDNNNEGEETDPAIEEPTGLSVDSWF